MEALIDGLSELSCVTGRLPTSYCMQSQSDAMKIPTAPCTMSSAEFLSDPKRALEMVASGTQVCVKSDKTEIILGFEPLEQSTIEKKALYRRTKGTQKFTSSTTKGPVNVSWLE